MTAPALIRGALLGALALVFAACGGGNDESSPGPVGPTVTSPGASGGGGLYLTVDHPSPLRSGTEVGWTLSVRNDGPAVTLEFPSGQNGDVVLRQGGQERYRWSAGRAFTQVFRQVPMGPGEVRSFELAPRPLDVAPGVYELVASLSARPAPHEVSETVRVA